MNEISFILNGQKILLQNPSPTKTLLDWLREEMKLTGTKEGCNEGDCGACTVLVTNLKGGKPEYKALNACILFLPQINDKVLRTIEGIKDQNKKIKIQREMITQHGSQCGFCTPGFIVSLVTGQLNNDRNHDDVIAGNLCRCTGYAPIIGAAEAAEDDVKPSWVNTDNKILKQLSSSNKKKNRKAYLPQTIKELEKWYTKNPKGTLVGGATDVGLWVTKNLSELKEICFIGQIEEMSKIDVSSKALNVGASTTIETLRHELQKKYPDFSELLRRYGSMQVRNAATLGGNIANGSPIGDSPPALIAIGASILLNQNGKHRKIAIEDFFIKYGQQDRHPGEFIESIEIPLTEKNLKCYKISKRFDQDISAICGCFNITLEKSRVKAARIAFGGMAEIPKRAASVEKFLVGRIWSEKTISGAMIEFDKDFNPISDLRATSGYRKITAKNLLKKYYLEINQVEKNTNVLKVIS
jgi:xanthine dehydrogenase small subunit